MNSSVRIKCAQRSLSSIIIHHLTHEFLLKNTRRTSKRSKLNLHEPIAFTYLLRRVRPRENGQETGGEPHHNQWIIYTLKTKHLYATQIVINRIEIC